MGCHIDQLYIGDNWQSKRRGLSSPRCLFAGTRKCIDNIYGQTCCLFMDFANVSLQWLVFPMDLSAITGTHVCLRQVRDEPIWDALASIK